MTAVRAELCAICQFGYARELTEPRTTKAGASYAWRGWHCDYCGEGYTDDEQGKANAEGERMADEKAETVGDTLGEIYGRAAAFGWKRPESGRYEVAHIVAELAAMPPDERARLEAFCAALVAEAKGAS